MNAGRVDNTIALRGGALLTLNEATRFTGLSQEILLNNPCRQCRPTAIGKKFVFFEDDLNFLVKFLSTVNQR